MKYLQTDNQIEYELLQNVNLFKYLKFEKLRGEYIVTLIDAEEYEIIKGYGSTVVDTINDMHSNLI